MFILIPMLLTMQNHQSEVGEAQLARIIEERYSPIRDLELYCEGRAVRYLDPETKQRGPATTESLFQSSYACRLSDGATHLDIYRRFPGSEKTMQRWTIARLDSETLRRVTAPDHDAGKGRPALVEGSREGFQCIGSPERFLALFVLKGPLTLPGSSEYRFEGWEDVDGHRCLRFSIVIPPGTSDPAKGSLERFWVDLERGGHMLKYELINSGRLWMRKENIELAEFSVPGGGRIWFPVRGEVVGFYGPNGPVEEPVVREIYGLVRGSLAFNRGLPDARFSMDWDGAKAASTDFALMKEEYDLTPKTGAMIPLTNLTDIQNHLDEKMVEAERQAKMLEASPPARRAWNSTTIAQSVLAIGGLIGLVVAVLFRRRA